MNIKFVGGRLDGHTITGTRRQPQHRDAHGQPIDYPAAIDRIYAARALGGIADVYCWDGRARHYVHLSRYIAACPALAAELTA